MQSLKKIHAWAQMQDPLYRFVIKSEFMNEVYLPACEIYIRISLPYLVHKLRPKP